jgi:hypothetical protein
VFTIKDFNNTLKVGQTESKRYFSVTEHVNQLPSCGRQVTPWKIAHPLFARKSLFVYLNFFFSLQQV